MQCATVLCSEPKSGASKCQQGLPNYEFQFVLWDSAEVTRLKRLKPDFLPKCDTDLIFAGLYDHRSPAFLSQI